MDITPVNEKSPGDCGYVCGAKGSKIALYASSLSAASDAAHAHFKLAKKDRGLLWVNLAERSDGTTVLQSTCS